MSARDTNTFAERSPRTIENSRSLSSRFDKGYYQNPIISADYSDPDVIRVGNDFFMTASSFNCTPGLPILHSLDLVNWQLIGHAVRNLPSDRFDQVQPGCGIWAPSIRYHDQKFWIFFPMPDEGVYVTTATNAAGPWSHPHLLHAGRGFIDPCPLWDDDGTAYLVHAFAHSRSGIQHRLHVSPMSPDGMKLLGRGHVVYDRPDKHPILEGPKFLKKDGWYYILAPAGGVATGWQVALRSREIFGPYEDRIVLEQGGAPINGPHQGALVDTGADEWWFIHFQDAGPYGRIVHLQPVTWEDGWPLIGVDDDGNGVGEPVLKYHTPRTSTFAPHFVLQTSDEFESPSLGLQWQWNANHRQDWYSLSAEPGWLRLYARPAPGGNIAFAPHLLMQKLPARTFTATTLLRLPQNATNSTRAGLIVMGQTYAGLIVSIVDGALKIEQVSCADSEPENLTVSNGSVACHWGEIALRVQVREGAECMFSYSLDGREFISLGHLFSATPGKWIGAKIGIVCTGDDSYADFDYFRIS
jgi:beta-xylosidase